MIELFFLIWKKSGLTKIYSCEKNTNYAIGKDKKDYLFNYLFRGRTNDKRKKKNEPCQVILTLNPETNMVIAGKILRLDKTEAIIAFLSMDKETFYHLKRLMQYNTTDADRIEKEIKNPAFV